jgi:hypothetical protein
LAEQQATDQAAVVLVWVGTGLHDKLSAGTILPGYGQGEVPQCLKVVVRVAARIRRPLLHGEGQQTRLLGDQEFLDETPPQPLLRDVAPRHQLHQVKAAHRPERRAVGNLPLLPVDLAQDVEVVPPSHRPTVPFLHLPDDRLSLAADGQTNAP